METWGQSTGRPVLVVTTPGYAELAYQPLLEALESQGLAPLVLRFGPWSDDPSAALHAVLREASGAGDWQETAIVAHGLGGRLLVEALGELPSPRAVALLGVPLELQPVALTRDLADRSAPTGSVELDSPAIRDATWQDQPILPLLLGSPLPPMERVSGPWLGQLAQDLSGGVTLDLDIMSRATPTWVALGDLDNLAPPECVRPHVGQAEVVRFGPLRMDGQHFDSADLLRHPRPLTQVARWLARADAVPEAGP